MGEISKMLLKLGWMCTLSETMLKKRVGGQRKKWSERWIVEGRKVNVLHMKFLRSLVIVSRMDRFRNETVCIKLE